MIRTDRDGQEGSPGTRLQPFVVEVRDKDGNRVPNIGVYFSVTPAGSGALSDETTITDENGRAETMLTLGSVPGEISVEAEVAGTSLKRNFTAMVNVPPSVYWVEDGRLYRSTIGSGEEEQLVPSVEKATSLAVDMKGNKIYWTEQTSDRTSRIRSANLDGTGVRDIRDLTSVPLEIVHDAVNGRLYLINSWGKIQRINVDGTNLKTDLIVWKDNEGKLFPKQLFSPKGLAVDPASKKLYWTEQTSDRTGEIWCADLDGTSLRQVKHLLSIFEDIAVDAVGGKLYLASAWGKIQRINVDGSGFEDVITGLEKPTDVVVDAENGKLYWIEGYKIRRADLNGNNIEDVVEGR